MSNPYGALSRRWREDVPRVTGSPVVELPAWLAEARAHLHRHHPTEGLAESVLWALAARGFALPPPELPDDDEDEDVLEPLRRWACP